MEAYSPVLSASWLSSNVIITDCPIDRVAFNVTLLGFTAHLLFFYLFIMQALQLKAKAEGQ